MKFKMTLIAAVSTTSLCAQNLITNGSFETGPVTFTPTNANSATIYNPNGWSNYSHNGSSNPAVGSYAVDWTGYTGPSSLTWLQGEGLTTSSNPTLGDIATAQDGDRMGFVWVNQLGLYQDVLTQIGQSYVLTGILGNPESVGSNNSSTGAIASIFVDGIAIVNIVEGDWDSFSYGFQATTNSTRIQIGFSQNDTGPGNTTKALVADNLSLTGVPEPSATLLICMGGISGLLRRRREFKHIG